METENETAYGPHVPNLNRDGKCRTCGFTPDDGRAEHQDYAPNLARLRAAVQTWNATPDLGVEAAREYARWHLGSASWADSILRAYLDPVGTMERLAEERRA